MNKAVTRRVIEDLRDWISWLDEEGQLARVTAPVDWNEEMGTVARRAYDVLGDASPAMLFQNIKDYPAPGPHQVFLGQFRSYARLAMMFGLDPRSSQRRDIIARFRECLRHTVPHQLVATGPCKDVIKKGDDINVLEFPVPLWHRRDGGRYVGTMHGVVTKDLNSDWVNIGLYRVMILDKNRLAVYLRPGRQHIGQQFLAYRDAGKKMPVAIIIGLEPALPFCASSGIPRGVCEYDVAGSIKGAPMEVTKCETIDLPVPANSEIVIEGYIDPTETAPEGPFGEYPGYYGEVPGRSPIMHITAITHRENPIFQGSLEGHPINESHVMASVSKTATAWEALENAGITGIRDVATLPESASAHIVVSCKMSVAGQPDWICSVLWGQSNATWHWKHVIVVDEDIDPWDSQMVTWAVSWRVKATEDIKIWPRHRGSPIDPRASPDEKGYWDRVLIDATRPFSWQPRAIWGSEGVNKGEPQKYPPTTIPETELIKQVNARWDEYGINPTRNFIGTSKGMMSVWWENPDAAAAGLFDEALGEQTGM
ncbi:MAG: UbiD family decarboxylase [Pseudorhodoplanes sp.]|uniref:UbiD family decarboxylase n=1 Tax=Pseudorhodoplanes sp. TaxID=1934341 RepID=UPI003D0E384C